MNNKKIALGSFIVGAAISFSAIPVFASTGFFDFDSDRSPSYTVNKSGLTYGSVANSTSANKEPDLISAVGINGTSGYVYSKDLKEVMPRTPEEAVAITQAREQKILAAKSSEPIIVKKIPLYDKEGRTVIGEFAITGGLPQ